MAVLTIDEIKALDYGYLTGADLLRFCPFQVLQKQYAVDADSLDDGCKIAYSELKSSLSARYDISTELTKTADTRYPLTVKLAAIFAIRNIVGNQAGLPDNMVKNFDWADRTIMNIRNGQESLISLNIASTAKLSNTSLISSSFEKLG